MEDDFQPSVESMRSLLERRRVTPAVFKQALSSMPLAQQDAWVDRVFGLSSLPDDGPDLPRGCVPYLPCPAGVLLRAAERAAIGPRDVVVDVGSGTGRAGAVLHLLTGASVIGLEIQSALVRASSELMAQLNVTRFFPILGDAAILTPYVAIGSVFFLYCPFAGDRLERVLDGLRPLARAKELRLCCVCMSVPARSWLTPIAAPDYGLTIYRTTLHRQHPRCRAAVGP